MHNEILFRNIFEKIEFLTWPDTIFGNNVFFNSKYYSFQKLPCNVEQPLIRI